MEIENNFEACPYNGHDLDIYEGTEIEALKSASKREISDPDEWLDEQIKRNVFVTTVDWLIDWARRTSMWTAVAYPACCAMEWMSVQGPRFDLSRFGMEVMRSSPRQADLIVTAGTLTWKMAPQIKRIYDQMADPKWVIAIGSCACSGGIFSNSYSVVPGYNHIIPVDIYIPGCPPRPEGMIHGIQMLRNKIAKSHVDIKLPALKEG